MQGRDQSRGSPELNSSCPGAGGSIPGNGSLTYGFEDACKTAGAFEMSDVGFDRAAVPRRRENRLVTVCPLPPR